MALQGNLRDFSVSEILQLLGTQKKTGCLVLKQGSEDAVLYVSEGRVVSSRDPGMGPDDALIRFLKDIHRLPEEQYRGLLTIHRETGRDLEDLLINGRYMETDELAGYVERQILDTLLRLSQWDNGTYRFDPAVTWKSDRLVRLSTEGVLIEAARRVDERKRFGGRFADPHQVLSVRDLPDPTEPLSDEERELFGIIDGKRTLSEVTAAAPLTEYETHEALDRMMEEGWVEPVGRRDPGLAVAETPVLRSPMAPVIRRSVGRELAVTATALVAVAVLVVGGHLATRASAVDRSPSDVFVAAQMRDLRKVLELYSRENGRYPDRLDQLVSDHWLSPRELEVPGHRLVYRPQAAGANYRIQLERAN
jgi:hypothetical protein